MRRTRKIPLLGLTAGLGIGLCLTASAPSAPATPSSTWSLPPAASSPTTPAHHYPRPGKDYRPPTPAWTLPPAAPSPTSWTVFRQPGGDR